MNLRSDPTPFMTVDTGLNMGYALWPATAKMSPIHGVRRCPAKLRSREDKVRWAYDSMCWLLEEFEPQFVALESQELWGGSADSYASGSRGDLFLLAYLTGACAGACSWYQVAFRLLPAREWKGQMGKGAVNKRIARAMGGNSYPDHAADAIGMGLSLMGLL